ncbi:MAG: BlaI/MecI/CopY family transcriptional regulator [Verrucomicrobia bacterium]|nr:BlaI/MecI/CopY family transcriptional regulator [Verrucomicrobiota bacterium]
MNKIKTALANSELSIMELLWKKGSQTARQIREQLYPDTDHTQHGTVQRLLLKTRKKSL